METETGNPDDRPLAIERRSPEVRGESLTPQQEGPSPNGSGLPSIGTDEDTVKSDVAQTAAAQSDSSSSSSAESSNQECRPEVHYSSRSDICQPVKLVKDIANDFVNGRELAWRLFVRNIRGLYRQTFFGLFWAFLPPVANTAFWVFLREAQVFKTGDMQVNSTVFILTGMIFWQAFIDSFQMPLNMMAKNRNMISKLNFPRESLLMVGIGEVAFDLAIRLLLLIPAFLYFGISIHASIVLMPIVLVMLILFGAGLGLLLLPVGSLYQDVGRFIGIAMPFWMILTPIVYPPYPDWPGSLLNWVNPASPLILVARDWTLLGATSHGAIGWTFGLIALPVFLLGLVVYRVSIPVLVERMNA